MIRCPHEHHDADCEALVSIDSHGIGRAWCKTLEHRYRALYGPSDKFNPRPWPADQPMWDYNEEERREYYFDPITREEVPAPDPATHLRFQPEEGQGVLLL